MLDNWTSNPVSCGQYQNGHVNVLIHEFSQERLRMYIPFCVLSRFLLTYLGLSVNYYNTLAAISYGLTAIEPSQLHQNMEFGCGSAWPPTLLAKLVNWNVDMALFAFFMCVITPPQQWAAAVRFANKNSLIICRINNLAG
jgi:hypothetical protein